MTQTYPVPFTGSAGNAIKVLLPQALSALRSCFAGTSEPSAPEAYMVWVDTTNLLIKRRNAANSDWVVEGKLFADVQKTTVDQQRWGQIAATVSVGIWITDGACRIDELVLSALNPTTSDGTDNWTVQLANVTDTLNLLSAAFTTNGSDFVANTPKVITLDQNQTIATAGKQLNLVLTKNGSATALDQLLVSLRLSRAV